MNTNLRAFSVSISLILAAACTTDSTQDLQDGLGMDAGNPIDSGTADVGAPVDSGIGDTGTSTRADAGIDAGTDGGSVDAGPADVGSTPDAGGGLGAGCADGAECASGLCFNSPGPGSVCSLCRVNGDCGVQQECDYDRGLGYAMCVGAGDLGDTCSGDGQCASAICNMGVCSQCRDAMDCGTGATCLDDRTGVGYFSCSGGLGDRCTTGTECGSGFCFNPRGPGANRCSQCEVNGDCAVQQECDYSRQDQYASCVGTGDLGDTCVTADQCSNDLLCTGNICSQCGVNADCGPTGTCVDDTAGAGYWACLGGLGDTCTADTQCSTGFCYNPPGPGRQYCSECSEDMDCGMGLECDYSSAIGHARCVGTGDLGDTCMVDQDCGSLFCNSSVCSECNASPDCTVGGTCTDNTRSTGHWTCEGGLGARCNSGTECGSGFCFASFACSECETAADCPMGQCMLSFQTGYATCQ